MPYLGGTPPSLHSSPEAGCNKPESPARTGRRSAARPPPSRLQNGRPAPLRPATAAAPGPLPAPPARPQRLQPLRARRRPPAATTSEPRRGHGGERCRTSPGQEQEQEQEQRAARPPSRLGRAQPGTKVAMATARVPPPRRAGNVSSPRLAPPTARSRPAPLCGQPRAP